MITENDLLQKVFIQITRLLHKFCFDIFVKYAMGDMGTHPAPDRYRAVCVTSARRCRYH